MREASTSPAALDCLSPHLMKETAYATTCGSELVTVSISANAGFLSLDVSLEPCTSWGLPTRASLAPWSSFAGISNCGSSGVNLYAAKRVQERHITTDNFRKVAKDNLLFDRRLEKGFWGVLGAHICAILYLSKCPLQFKWGRKNEVLPKSKGRLERRSE